MTAIVTVQPQVAERDVQRRRRGAALEHAILDAALTELSEVGYGMFSVEGVAARATTGKASIYRRWPTKQELVTDALLASLPGPLDCGVPAEIPDSVSTADLLYGVARRITAVLCSPSGNAIRAIKCEAAGDPVLAQVIDERFQAPRRAAMIRLLRRGIERGEVRPGADIALVADVLPAVLAHRVILQRQPITAHTITDIMQHVIIPLVEVR
jgi:AcrR family transcriptional regulator